MADVLLFHHVQGLTDGVRAFAADLEAAGHVVHTPDLFEGRTFDTIGEGLDHVRSEGFDVIGQRGVAVADALPADLVYAGFSYGVTLAQRLAQTRPGARGALFFCSCLPVSEFGDRWPAGLPVQIHGKEGDEFFDEDLLAAQELADAVDVAELYLYPGEEHLFADSSLAAYDAAAAELMTSRVLTFLSAT
ncbi:dienelactone hydrolase [Marmoricola sp. OAE513]|uniref:dienelactone hydrolase family protein n=1 Tax=Marmoricola sp. OAE513 TaxID=2817894 RepID=UPI001AE23206